MQSSEEVDRLGKERKSGDRAGKMVIGVWNVEIVCCENFRAGNGGRRSRKKWYGAL